MIKAGIISLGCARNLCDSEVIAGSLKREGLEISDVEKGVDVCVVNTCAFIGSAREESVEVILEASRLKREGRIKRLVVCGCLPQLYRDSIKKSLPEVDLFLGAGDFPHLARILKTLKTGKNISKISRVPGFLYDDKSPRLLLTSPHYAYVKIQEGCSNACSYCIISRLRGPFRSRDTASIIEEVRKISRSGVVKEINIIGQDTTLFGYDRNKRLELAGLLKALCRLRTGVEWIRVLYTHPAHYTDDLVSVISDEEKLCKYLDLPIQHISDRILWAMNRYVTRDDISRLIERLRHRIPELTLRTSVIVGFPGETDAEFKELLKFLRETGFERLGAFIYSREEGTRAAGMRPQVPERVKRERLDRLMKLQQRISLEKNMRLIGKTVKVLIDSKNESLDRAQDSCRAKPRHAQRTTHNESIGRMQGDAPDVDGVVYVMGKPVVKIGAFYNVRITSAMEYDLVGKAV
jgi:ribosomal protein S12 methylthiotransferase